MGVRREAVRLELQDAGFTSGVARAAAAAALLERNLDDLDGTSVKTEKSLGGVKRETNNLVRPSKDATKEIDRLSGRMRILFDAAAALGPALIPVGAVAVPALSGLASQMGAAALGAGTALIAFQGVGDALKAVNEFALKPTEQSMKKAEEALRNVSAPARDLVAQLQALRPEMRALRDTAAAGVLPGVSDALTHFETILPEVERLFRNVGGAVGDIARDTGESFASDRWAPFLDFIALEAPRALRDLADAVGNTVHAMANLWMAFTPLNTDFSDWLVDATERLDDWSHGLAATEGFQEFVEYIRTTGPILADALGSIANAFLQIIQATAPMAGPVLKTLEAFFDVIAAIADSPVGTPLMAIVVALGAMNTALRIGNSMSLTAFGGPAVGRVKTMGATYAGLGTQVGILGRNFLTAGAASERMAAQNAVAMGKVRGALATTAKAGGGVAGVALLASGATEKLGITNATVLGLAGSIAGPLGAAIGAAAGGLMDLAAVNDRLADSITAARDTARNPNASLEELIERRRQLVQEFAEISHVDTRGSMSGMDPVGDFKRGVAFLSGDVGQTKDAIKDIDAAIKGAREEMTRSTTASRRFGVAQMDLKAVLQETRDEARKQAEKWLEFGDSLKANGKGLEGFLKSMEDQAKALEDFTDNARKAGEKGLKQGLIDKLEEMGPAGALRMRQLANASEEEIARANAAFDRGVTAMREYEEFQLTPKDLNINPEPALRTVRETLKWIRAQKPFLQVDVRVNRPRVLLNNGVVSVNNIPVNADGGTIPKTGRPYADRHLRLLADGEEVISNRHGQADKNRAALKAANRGATLAVIGHADGGTVRAYQRPVVQRPASYAGVPAAAMEIDYGRLARAVAAARPLHGDVILPGADYATFKREMEADRARAAATGPY
ncbi:MAG TPA: hypothetical protein VJL80_09755 [Aeromicrobium sp.]|nr:hypothetical protein [Aeromicrobium sp.]HKY58310.1 hypothetical protein [Aeromicrobium sp.]